MTLCRTTRLSGPAHAVVILSMNPAETHGVDENRRMAVASGIAGIEATER